MPGWEYRDDTNATTPLHLDGRPAGHTLSFAFSPNYAKDGRLLRFVWACYSRAPAVKTSDIFYQSLDEGKTWNKMPTFVSDRFAWYPHRLRTLRDGTLVLAAPRAPKWGKDSDYPIRAAMKLQREVGSDTRPVLQQEVSTISALGTA